MQIGQQVYYRVSAEDAEKVNRWRRRAVGNLVHHQQEDNGKQIHFGMEIETGQLLPATVVVAYSARATKRAEGFEHIPGTNPELSFSGYADIRVLLPGNDVLFVPGAVEDKNCKVNYSMGHGVTALPDYGMFTQSVPASLLG